MTEHPGVQAALALVDGQPLTECPADLYIPPEALEVYLDRFEGPLDLLSWLIRRHRMNVLDIPMAELTAQYMKYVGWMQSRRLELAADYLVMAVWLIEIKSRMLLPRPAVEAADGEEDDPRARLVRKLIEYEHMRLAAERLDALPWLERDHWPAAAAMLLPDARPPLVSALDLESAWQDLLQRTGLKKHHRAARKELSVREAMGRLLNRLQGDLFIDLAGLVAEWSGDTGQAASRWVVNLLAVLELAREQQVELVQNEAFAPIYLRLAEGARHGA